MTVTGRRGQMTGRIIGQILLNGLAALLWLVFVSRRDKAGGAKGPKQRLPRFFFSGMLSVPLALVLSFGVSRAVTLLFTGSSALDYFVDEFFTAGAVEELSKFFIFFLMTRRLNSIIEPKDGVLQACTIALGFATVENFLYGLNYGAGTTLYRSLMCTSGHMVYSFLWSSVYSLVVVTTRRGQRKGYAFPMMMGMLPAALLHGLYNFFLDLGRNGFAVAVNIAGLIAALVIFAEMKKKSPYTPHTRQDYEAGFPLVLQALMNHPDNFELNYRAGRHSLYCHDFAAAAGYLGVCHRLKPGHAKSCLCYSAALAGMRRYHQAKTVFDRRFRWIDDEAAGKLWQELRRFRLPYALRSDLRVLFRDLETAAVLQENRA